MSIDHRTEAEELLKQAAREFIHPEGDPTHALAAAIAHSNLARDEDQAARTADMRDAITLLRRREYATREAVAAHIAKGLASREVNRWGAARSLAQALDEAGANMEDLIDARLSDDGYDTKTPWTAPAPLIHSTDPWAEQSTVTAEIPEPVRRVLADRLARALLNDGDGQSVARTLAFALKNEGADLTGDIQQRITELTLGRDPSDPPF